MKSAPPPETIKVLNPLARKYTSNFLHWLIGKLVVVTVEPGMLGRLDPVADSLVEFVGRHAGVSRRQDFQQRVHQIGFQRRHVTLQRRLDRHVVLPFRVRGCQSL